MSRTPPRLRGGASLRLSKFVPDEFVEPLGFSPTLSLRQIRKKPQALLKVFVAWRGIVRPVHEPNPSAFARRGQPAAVQIRSRRICRTVRVLTNALSPPDTQKAPGAVEGIRCAARDCSAR